MGLLSVRGRREIDAYGPPWAPSSSSNPTGRHGSYGSDRQSPKSLRIRDLDPGRPVNGPRQYTQSSSPRDRYPSQDQDIIQVFFRNPKELHEESFYNITPDTATNYPCTQKDLNASGGAHRRESWNRFELSKTKWFAHPNNGPFIGARKATREIFDHNNDKKRKPSATEEEAISRLITGFRKAGREPWGPDLAIKAFCDLDRVFFCGRLKGPVCLTWYSERAWKYIGNSRGFDFGYTEYIGKGRCVIRLNAYRIFFSPLTGSCFGQMFGTLLHEMCHAHQMVRALDDGPKGWQVGKADGHGKNFGTMMLAVRRRARVLLGLEGDPKSYPCHDYALDNEPRPGPKHIHSHIHPHIHPPPRHQRRSTTAPTSRRELYHAAFTDITLDSGTSYACMQSDLEATGGLSRQSYPEDSSKDRRASKRKWFSQPNHGPFVTPRQASRDIFEHNDPRRKPDKYERGAIERLSNAIEAGRHGDWSPDLIIKAFCDLDTVFFGGRLRGHVCVRWQPDWSPPASGETVYLGDGKCSIRLNADDLLLKHPRAFERMFLTTLHEMCHADAVVRVHEREMLECAGHGKNFGTKLHAVENRARRLFGLHSGDDYPRHKYERGEGYP